MPNHLAHHMSRERENIIKKCTQCGLCIKKCPISKYTELQDITPSDVQKEVIKFLEGGTHNQRVYTRAFSCMQCFGCIDNYCPQGLNPLLVNEMIKWDYNRNNFIEFPYNDPREEDALQRIIASTQISSTDYKRIFSPLPKKKADYVFFPGCNVYFQPDKLLSALDIMDIIDGDWTFVPGLDFCCGDVHINAGTLEEANKISQELIAKLASYNPQTVIFWCPTCLCRFGKSLETITEIPFKMVSFPQFVAENIDKLPFKKELNKTVTLHEACKSAFSGLDLNGARDILKGLPGLSLIEMERHGKNTSCCGSGAVTFFPESFALVGEKRMQEAAATRADILVDVCHFCHEVFMTREQKYDYSVVNYISLVAEALGIEREEKLKKYKQLNDIDKVLDDAQDYIKQSPFSQEKIIQALTTIIEK